MKQILNCVVVILLLSLCANNSFSQSLQRAISSSTVSTPELDQVTCGSSFGNCPCSLDDKWCYKPTDLIVRVPDSKWVFIGAPYLVIDDDGKGSAAWNMLDRRDHIPGDRFKVTLNNPDEIRVTILSSSHSIKCHIECLAQRD
jgi:hypothetical protein